MPVQVEDRLPGPCAGIHDDTVVRQPAVCSDFGDEVEHPLALVGRELAYVLERLDVTLGQHEQVRIGLRIDVTDSDEPLRRRDVVTLAIELAEKAVVVHAANTPSSVTEAPRTRTNSPIGTEASRSQGE